MANEITNTAHLKAILGSLAIDKSSNTKIDWAGGNYTAETITLTTTPTPLMVPAGTLGWTWLLNLSATNNIEVGFQLDIEYGGTFAPMILLYPGESCAFPLFTNDDMSARSVAATAKLEYVILDR